MDESRLYISIYYFTYISPMYPSECLEDVNSEKWVLFVINYHNYTASS